MELHSEIPEQQDLKIPFGFYAVLCCLSYLFDNFIHVMFLPTALLLQLCLELHQKGDITIKTVFVWLR